MCPFDLAESMSRAQRRFGSKPPLPGRKHRSDRGVSRLDPEVIECVARSLSGHERPRMRETIELIGECCRAKGLQPPSRATIYKLMVSLPGIAYRVGDLPDHVQDALYNLAPESRVPGRQVAYYCFNYGNLRAMSFAAGLPWLALYQALRLRGYHQKSRGPIEAAAMTRGI